MIILLTTIWLMFSTLAICIYWEELAAMPKKLLTFGLFIIFGPFICIGVICSTILNFLFHSPPDT